MNNSEDSKQICSLVQDLLPLYHDQACSRESAEIMNSHLSECSICRECYTNLCGADKMVITDQEMKKAASFQSVQKKLLRKQIGIAVMVVILMVLIAVAVVITLKNSVQVIDYEDNISVSMTTENHLIGRLEGNQANRLKIKRVDLTVGGEENSYLFFCLSGTKWEELITNSKSYSEYVLCPADKGAEQVDKVFYYTGDSTGIENMGESELQKVIDRSILLWSK